MKTLLFPLLVTMVIFWSCTTSKSINTSGEKRMAVNDTVRISNDSLEYEVIIVDPGFTSWLITQARPRQFYGLDYLENKNRMFVTEWNNRVMQPQRYSPDLYEMRINYDWNIKYGYEVNYMIYNYLVYFQNKYKQRFSGYVPQ